MLKLAVIGSPIFHSKSPLIYNYLAHQNSVPLYYNRFSASNAQDAFDFARDLNMDGYNVTSPFKRTIIPHLSRIDYQSSILNSANTILFRDIQNIDGFNTDYFGILQIIWDEKIDCNRKKVLILGCGISGQITTVALKNFNSIISLWDRDLSKAIKVSNDNNVNYINDDDLRTRIAGFDIIISTIPPNSDILNELTFSSHQIIIDSIYHNSFFENKKNEFGFRLISAYNWLINQAVFAFELFTKIKVKKAALLEVLNHSELNVSKSIIFAGFSGSGKTTFGRLIAEKLGLNFIDLDEEIEKKMKMNIPEIFSQFGEKIFREKERELLIQLNSELKFTDKLSIIAVGGGIFEYQENRDLLKNSGKIVWIYSTFEKCYDRISDLRNRPLIIDKMQAKELYERRKDTYFFSSEMIFSNNGSFEEGISRLTEEISRII
ncbi:MAG: hypothetical protein A2X64_02445 [Ignavibacteria bacterium GWF2_33_9]|nr:MAG: hypothetical protein A2X64_02445 [Ignavibacteria bacterium GWF2_33_9]